MQTTVDTTVQCRWRMTLTREDVVELVRKCHPDANVPANADVQYDDLDIDSTPIVLTWTTTQTTHA